MKKQVVDSHERKGYEKKFVLSNLGYSVGVGGLHSINKPEIFRPNENEYIGHSDVASMYISLLIKYNLAPSRVGKNFCRSTLTFITTEFIQNIIDRNLRIRH